MQANDKGVSCGADCYTYVVDMGGENAEEARKMQELLQSGQEGDASYITHDLDGKYYAGGVHCEVVCEEAGCGCDVGKVVEGAIVCSECFMELLFLRSSLCFILLNTWFNLCC